MSQKNQKIQDKHFKKIRKLIKNKKENPDIEDFLFSNVDLGHELI